MILYVPVWRGEAIYGLVYLPVRLTDLLGALRAEQGASLVARPQSNLNLAVQISDGTSVLYSNFKTETAFQATSNINVAGRTWRVSHTAPASFGRDWAAVTPWLVLLAGAAVALLTYLMFQAQVRARQRAEDVSRSLALSRSAWSGRGRSLKRFSGRCKTRRCLPTPTTWCSTPTTP